MTPQEAIRILMLSPFYFRMNLIERKQLIVEFCTIHVACPSVKTA